MTNVNDFVRKNHRKSTNMRGAVLIRRIAEQRAAKEVNDALDHSPKPDPAGAARSPRGGGPQPVG
jgi:hypothetical protein